MTDALLHIDLKAILRKRGGKAARVPGFVVGWIERLVHQSELNEVLSTAWPREGWEFAEATARYYDLKIITEGLERLPEGGRFIFASNHPLGGLDGISIIATLGKRYGNDNFRFLVNDMLMNVEPLRNVFLPINKYGAQGRTAAKAINEAYASDAQIAIFPAGLVSRIQQGGIKDLRWQKAFVSKAFEFDRAIVPVHFIGLNSRRFYKLAQWRKRLGIKINLEQILLPGEMSRSRGKTFRIVFGEPVPPAELHRIGKSPAEIASAIKERVYSLG